MTQKFAHVKDGLVDNIIVSTQSIVNALDNASEWVEFFRDANSEASKRYNCASIGANYDATNDAFYEPQPFPSWSLDSVFLWQPPVSKPEDTETHSYYWDEDTLSWVQFELEEDEE